MGFGLQVAFPFKRMKSVKAELIKMHIYFKYTGRKLLVPHNFKHLNTHILIRRASGLSWCFAMVCISRDWSICTRSERKFYPFLSNIDIEATAQDQIHL